MNTIILDVDTGEDDALAVLLAVKKRLPLHYVVTSYGNSTLENATRNTSAMLGLAGEKNIQVIQGSSKSLSQHPHQSGNASAGEFVGKNGLCNAPVPECIYNNILAPTEADFPSFLFEKIKTAGSVDYIITGPCTNFARMLHLYKNELKKYIQNIYIMGGAIYTPGNSGPVDQATGTQLAEFNFYCDAVAAREVLQSGLPVSLISWDITSNVTIPYAKIELMQSETDLGKFVIELMRCFFKYYGLSHERNFELNDPLTVLAQQGAGTYKRILIDVVTHSDGYGKSYETPEGYPVRYFELTQQDKKQLIQDIIESLEIRI